MLTTETTLETNKFLTSKLKKDFISKMMFNILKLSLGIAICLGMLIMANQAATISAYQSDINKLQNNNEKMKSKMEKLETEVIELNEELTEQKRLNSDLGESFSELNSQLKEAVKSNKSYKKELELYKEREELLNKYEYCIKYDGKRTGLTYDQIKYGEELMEEKGYDPNLLFSIIMVESRGDASATNKYSGAKGLGQFMDESGKFVYEKLMKRGTYYTNYAYNGTTNIEMMVTYLDYLIKNRKTLRGVLMTYSGRDETNIQPYINEMNKFSSVNQIAANIYS